MKFLLTLSLLISAVSTENWPAFRGYGNSLTTATNLPVTWSETDNLAWKVDLKGYGQSSPVVWGELVIVTSTSGEHKENLLVQAFDLKTGESKWEYQHETKFPVPKVSNYISQSAPTPVIDGGRVFAFFESGEVLALDHQGNLKWERSLQEEYGEFKGNHGLGSSLAITDNNVVLLIDHAGPSYLLSLNKKDGQNNWQVDRPERVSWSSPVITGSGAEQQIVVSSNGAVQAFSAQSGEQLWEKSELDGNNVPSPTVVDDQIAIASSKRGSNLVLQTSASAQPQVRWENKKITSSFGSPLIHAGRVYYVSKAGVASCLNLETGEELWKERLSASCWASPLGAGEHVYFFTKAGTTQVIEAAGDAFKVVSTNELPTDDKVYGIAAVEGHFVIRTGKVLYCVGKTR